MKKMRKIVMAAMIMMCTLMVTSTAFALEATNVLEASGTITETKNGKPINYTFKNGTVTLSGEGDELVDSLKSPFIRHEDITAVDFAADCKIESLAYMFSRCKNIAKISNIPNTVKNMNYAFEYSAITEIPTLPNGLERAQYAFVGCEKVKEYDFSKIPATCSQLAGFMKSTGITTAYVPVTFKAKDPNSGSREEYSASYMLSKCENLKSIVVDAKDISANTTLWLQGIAEECSKLETFELINCPKDQYERGLYCGAHIFQECKNLKSVKIDGYVHFTLEEAFTGCEKLESIQCDGFTHIYPSDGLETAFENCKSLRGDIYIEIADNSDFKTHKDAMTEYDNKLKKAFLGTTKDFVVHMGDKRLFDYFTAMPADATIVYWAEGDKPAAFIEGEENNNQYEEKKDVTIGYETKVSGNTYVVTNTGKTPTVAVKKTTGKTVSIPATVKINGKKYEVSSIKDNAFAGNKKITSLVIGSKVKKIGTKAFYNVKTLKKITVKSTKLKSIGKKAFAKINAKAVVKIPKKKYSKYKKMFKKAGMTGKKQKFLKK